MKKYYFLGIGGTAMGSVAVAVGETGATVTGADEHVYAPMSDYLEQSGIQYYDGYDPVHIEREQPDVIVVGNAVSRGNVELEYALDKRMELMSMPDVVRQLLIARHTSIVVAGTHGKTTTTSLAAWLLEVGEKQPGFMIGGIAQNFGRGCRAVPASVRNTEDGIFVTEGDEYDTAFFDKRSKFLLYRPDIAIVNNIEFDHADIFASLEDIRRTFTLFVRLIPRSGLILVAYDEPDARSVAERGLAPIETFGIVPEALWHATDITTENGESWFTLFRERKEIGRFKMPLVGDHNVKNAVAALAAGLRVGVAVEKLQQGLASFEPPKRRMEVIYEAGGITVVDDFAHHPTAVKATLQAVRKKYPERRIIACFEPRSNSTTRNIFQQELKLSLAEADIVAVGVVNRPDRYKPEELLNVERLAEDLQLLGKKAMFVPQEQAWQPLWSQIIVSYLQPQFEPGDVIVMMSNGSFGNLKPQLLAALKARIGS